MRSLLFLFALAIGSGVVTFAQDKPKPEFFAGYTYERIDSGIKSSDIDTIETGRVFRETSLDNRFGPSGFIFSGTAYISSRVGITGQFSAAFQNRDDTVTSIDSTFNTRSNLQLFNFTGGPQVKFLSKRRAMPFAHALFGIQHRKLTERPDVPGLVFPPVSDTTNAFTMELGGGVDLRLKDRVDLRLIQLDYNPVFLKQRDLSPFFPTSIRNLKGRTLHGLRVSIGLVFR